MKWVRWWLVFAGGMLIGSGVLLHGQVAMAGYVRHDVDSVFFLWRGLAELTFMFHDDVTRTALFLSEVPEDVLVESNRSAWTLTMIGLLFVISAPQVRRRRKKRRRGSIT